jgi:F0F1-type ATP synthase assembly protein I
MPEGRAGGIADALFGMAARRVRLLTIIAIVGATALIAGQDASWTTIAVVGGVLLAIATAWLGALLWLRMRRPAGGRRGP